MEKFKSVLDNDHQEQFDLKLKLVYMVEDFVELIKKNEQKEPVHQD